LEVFIIPFCPIYDSEDKNFLTNILKHSNHFTGVKTTYLPYLEHEDDNTFIHSHLTVSRIHHFNALFPTPLSRTTTIAFKGAINFKPLRSGQRSEF
jgi:hypothetical protein